jgi:hypothetical protein
VPSADLCPSWRKSSYSGGEGGNCVELSNAGAVRDSKNPAVQLPVGQVAMTVLIATLQAGSGGR